MLNNLSLHIIQKWQSSNCRIEGYPFELFWMLIFFFSFFKGHSQYFIASSYWIFNGLNRKEFLNHNEYYCKMRNWRWRALWSHFQVGKRFQKIQWSRLWKFPIIVSHNKVFTTLSTFSTNAQSTLLQLLQSLKLQSHYYYPQVSF